MDYDFTKIMAEKSDEELIQIITVDRPDYVPKAVKTAEEEVRRRGIPQSEIDAIEIQLRPIRDEQELIKYLNKNQVEAQTRLFHFAVDGILVAVVSFLIIRLLYTCFSGIGYAYQKPLFRSVTLILLLAYYIFMESKYQQTIGKMITKTQVVTEEGTQPSTKRIIVRSLARLLFPLSILLNLLRLNVFNAFEPPLIHDILSSTKVKKVGGIDFCQRYGDIKYSRFWRVFLLQKP